MADVMDEDPSSGIQSSEEDQEALVESLVRGRAKRSTAGRHMSALLEAAADDDLALLFEEVEDDNEFADEVDPDVEEDVGLDSSEDDEDDQGPNAQNDYEGEKQLQKDERKKRKTQNDLRFQTLRKRVKIDPTAASSMAPAPRPKKKSERISWIPTVEDGPTRQSSRRQTMVNKELTHARLKDSQEKRVRIIATMKEAEKRKAHLKPKEMTQQDHLAEAARIERLNSKSLNRWELSEKRKADERQARIQELQNRRLDGPVISYWSGVATWTNGRLTRVGNVDIKPKPDKEEAKKKKKDKEDKEKAATDLQNSPAASIVAPPTAAGHVPTAITPSSQQFGTSVLPPTSSVNPNAPKEKTSSDNPIALGQVTPGATAEVPGASEGENASQSNGKISEAKTPATASSHDQEKDLPAEEAPAHNHASGSLPAQDKTLEDRPSEPAATKPTATATETTTTTPAKRPSFSVVIPTIPHPSQPSHESTEKVSGSPSAGITDDMDIDRPPAAAAANGLEIQNSIDKSDLATPNIADAQSPVVENLKPSAEHAAPPTSLGESQPVESVTPTNPAVALAPHAAPAAATLPSATAPESAITSSLNPPPTPQAELHSPTVKIEKPTEPEVPAPPPVIEHTGRTLTILEDFDYGTAQKPKYSMYFNAKKPLRLTSMCGLCFPMTLKANLARQKFRHRFALSHPCHHDTATQRPVSLTPIPTRMAKSVDS